MNNEGFKNEYAFAKELNKKQFKNLKKTYQNLILNLYPNVNDNDIIECWVSKYNEKSDIKIRINGIIKGISIKMGHQNSIHMEHISDFKDYLTKIGVDENIIAKIIHFVEWKKEHSNLKSYYYKRDFTKNYIEINNALNDYYVKWKLISRFLFEGNNRFHYSAHALVYGTPNKFLWTNRNEIMKYLIEAKNDSNATIKIGLLCLQTYSKEKKDFIQIKWHTIEKVLIEITKNRNNIEKSVKE